jgi:hypothetical protein
VKKGAAVTIVSIGPIAAKTGAISQEIGEEDNATGTAQGVEAKADVP